MKLSRTTEVLRRLAARSRLHGDAGQILVMMAIGSVALIGTSAFVVDVGAGFRGQRKAQSAADGSALAAAQMLPTSPGEARVASDAVAAKNLPDGTVSLSFASTYLSADTAVAKADTTSPSFLAKVLGFKIFAESADARAVTGSYTGWSNGLAPWVTDKQSIQWGTEIDFKVRPGSQANSGNFGSAKLPVRETGCALSSGSSDYGALINEAYNSCIVNVGNSLNPEPGNLANTGNYVQQRGAIQNFDPYSILTLQANGSYVLTTYDHPNLVVIPVIDYFPGGNSQPFTVTGFAWFIITSYSRDVVTGMFISSSAPGGAQCSTGGGSTTSCPIGGYSPYGFKVILLIK